MNIAPIQPRKRNAKLRGMASHLPRVNVDPAMIAPAAVNGYNTHPSWQITQGDEDPQRAAYIEKVLARLRERKVIQGGY